MVCNPGIIKSAQHAVPRSGNVYVLEARGPDSFTCFDVWIQASRFLG